ncbi:hypothetical protein KRM28CT15_36560 [Krasilnikovia sp. M28-CT-15]
MGENLAAADTKPVRAPKAVKEGGAPGALTGSHPADITESGGVRKAASGSGEWCRDVRGC